MPPEAGVVIGDQPSAAEPILCRNSELPGISSSAATASSSKVASHGSCASGVDDGVLVDDLGRPYRLGPEGFVRDLNTRAVKIARRIVAQSRAANSSATTAAKNEETAAGGTARERRSAGARPSATGGAVGTITGSEAEVDLGKSGTVRSEVAQEIRFVLGGRLPFVKRSEALVWTWVFVSLCFLAKCGLVECGLAPTLGAFVVMYFVVDFYSGVLHVVLDDEWNMKVPLLSQPAMEFQYHHHIPDDGCSRPFVEGMGDLNFIVGLHLVLFVGLFVRGGCDDFMLLTAGGWKMLLAYWGIWNHRQVGLASVGLLLVVGIDGR